MSEEKKVVLSARLSKIASFCSPDFDLIDIGSDHAYLPIYLSQNGYKKKIFCSEAQKGPYERMVSSLAFYGQDKRIVPLFGSGFALSDTSFQEAVIAGMGGLTIEGILKEGKGVLAALSYLVLEPQSEAETVRKVLLELGFKITDEAYTEEKRKIYPVIVSIPGTEKPYDEVELKYGRLPLQKKDPLLFKELKKEEKIYEDILFHSSQMKEEDSAQIKAKANLVKEGLARWKAKD
jgi:tRNA (adenine22-N1)-methyltransferase